MCKAMMEIIEESKEEGRKEGIRIGREEGIRISREEGIRIGRQQERDLFLNNLISGYQPGAIKLEFAAQLAGMSEEEFLEKTRAS